jgi:hypothetical protein
MKAVQFQPEKLFQLLTLAIPKTEDIPNEEALEMIIDLEQLLKEIRSNDKRDVFLFLVYVIDNVVLFPHLSKALRSEFEEEFRIMKEANRIYGGGSNEDLVDGCLILWNKKFLGIKE